jgi:hypothetical protein
VLFGKICIQTSGFIPFSVVEVGYGLIEFADSIILYGHFN